jgi:hypothetical protein
MNYNKPEITSLASASSVIQGSPKQVMSWFSLKWRGDVFR